MSHTRPTSTRGSPPPAIDCNRPSPTTSRPSQWLKYTVKSSVRPAIYVDKPYAVIKSCRRRNATAQYQVKPGGKVWVNINQLINLTGTPNSTNSVQASLPINASSYSGVNGSAQKLPGKVGVNDSTDVIEWYKPDYTGSNTSWIVNSQFWFRATAEYVAG